MLPYTSPIVEEASFFLLTYLGYSFMLSNLVRLNVAVLKISETSQDDTCGGVPS